MFIPGMLVGVPDGLADGIGIFIWGVGDAAGICIRGMSCIDGLDDGEGFGDGVGVGVACECCAFVATAISAINAGIRNHKRPRIGLPFWNMNQSLGDALNGWRSVRR